MDLQHRINAFSELGIFLSQFTGSEITKKEDIPHNELFFDGMLHQIKLSKEHNGWFTKENVLFALEGWASLLSKEKLTAWLSAYSFPKEIEQKNIAVIMAGNIPLVGFHDFLSVLISGHAFVGKQSSNDMHLLPFLAKYLEYVEPRFKGSILFTQDKLPAHDAVIATGSDNTARYFEYYFGKKPNIIRKNRNSVAVLTGKETPEELTALAEDIFRYYGLGCRNVSKLLVPDDYNFDAFFNAIYPWHDIVNQAKYANNYDYNKAVYLMSLYDMLENGFLMIKEDASYGSPIATVFYERYSSLETLKEKLQTDADKIQCVVSSQFGESPLERQSEEIAFGQTQKPQLTDYADGVDSIAFLLKI